MATQSTSRIYNWAIQKTESSRAPLWVGLLFFLELVLFIPLDAILMFFCMQNRKRIFLYVILAAAASTLSGFMGYLLGHLLWDFIGPYVVPNLISASFFESISHHYQQYESLAVFAAALLPLPLKALSLSAGICHLGLTPFLVSLFLARLVRFTLIGASMYFWGEQVKGFVDRHFHRILVVVGAKVAAALAIFWIFAR